MSESGKKLCSIDLIAEMLERTDFLRVLWLNVQCGGLLLISLAANCGLEALFSFVMLNK